MNKDQKLLEEAYGRVQEKEIENQADQYNRKQFYKDRGVYKQKAVIEFLNRSDRGYDSVSQECITTERWGDLLDVVVQELRYIDLTNEQKDAIIVFYKDLDDYDEEWFHEDLLDVSLFPSNQSYQDYLKYLEDNFSKFRELKKKLPELEGIF